MSIKLGIVAPLIFGTSGFSRAGRQIMFELYKLGIDIRIVGVKDPVFDRIITRAEYEQIKQFAANTWQPDVWFNLAPHCDFTLNGNFHGWKIGMSMWETLENPPSFATSCKLCDEIWVPSTFNFDTFHQNSGIPKERLAYMPLGVDTNLFSPRPSKIHISDDFRSEFSFVYGIVCGYSMRKGVDLVLNAHHELFSASDNVALIIKAGGFARKLFPQDMDQIFRGIPLVNVRKINKDARNEMLAKLQQNRPVVLYNFEGLTDLDLVEVFLAMDCLVFPSRGEGFGLPVAEAMSCEKPVIATKATGLDDLVHPDVSYVVPSTEWRIDPRCDWITPEYHGRSFADPDYNAYKAAVWDVYTNHTKATAVGKNARQFIVNNFESSAVASRMKRRLEEIVSGNMIPSNFWPEVSAPSFEGVAPV